MFRRMILLGVLMCMSGIAAAQPAGESADDARKKANVDAWRRSNAIRAQRLGDDFQKMYKLDDEQRGELQNILERLSERMLDYQLTSDEARRKAQTEFIETATQIKAAREAGDQAEEKRLRQIQQAARTRWMEFQSGGPLSPANVAEELEKFLPAPQAKSGRAAFESYVKRGNRMTAAPSRERTPTPTGPSNPTRDRAIDRFAPPLERWPAIVEIVILDRQYNTDQAARGRAILTNIRARAERAAAADASKASALQANSDRPGPRPADPINRLFDELMLRVEHVGNQRLSLKSEYAARTFAPELKRWEVAVRRAAERVRLKPEQTTEAAAIAKRAAEKAEGLLQATAEARRQAAAIEDPAAQAEAVLEAWAPLDSLFESTIKEVESMAGPAPRAKAPAS
ncbi:MAG: hypothetical protein V3T70_08410 [Phycisphaerae bacterium]